MYELEKKSFESIEEKAKQLYDEILRTKTVTIKGVTYKVDEVTLLKKRGVVSGWEVMIEGDPESYNYIIYDKEDRTYVTIHMKKPGIVLGVGLSHDLRRAVVIYDT